MAVVLQPGGVGGRGGGGGTFKGLGERCPGGVGGLGNFCTCSCSSAGYHESDIVSGVTVGLVSIRLVADKFVSCGTVLTKEIPVSRGER